MRDLAFAVLTFVLSSGLSHANDGFGGLAATGLTFGQTEAVRMESEDLFISPDRVAVDYTFRNITDGDVTGEVIFPLPPIDMPSLMNADWNLPEDITRPNLVNFTVTVEGETVSPQIDVIAVLPDPPEQGPVEPSAQYDNPGRDVTALLSDYGIPVTLDQEAILTALLALDDEARQSLQAQGLAEFFAADPETGFPEDAVAYWSVVYRYHWTQTFPAGKTLRIAHSYENRPRGGIFSWSHPPEDWQAETASHYCIDTGTSKAIAKRLGPDGYGTALDIEYVLRTANSWAGPIGQFRLTIDKGAAENILSLCADGVTKTGPTTFVVERRDYTPDRDLNILIVQPPR